ncbi:MAG: zinc ribbon domain-containing protein [Clostridia bacterium]|nr:zinc ribbon domain-containing protein [Clostridia bacterium]
MKIRVLLALAAIAVLLACCLGAAADDSWICPTCGHENPGRANFCGKCRTPQPEKKFAVESTSNAWVCSACSEVCPDEDTFCMICGEEHHPDDARAMMVPDTVMTEIWYEPVPVIEYRDAFSANKEKHTYNYTAPVTGTYRLWLSEANAGTTVHLAAFDASGSRLQSAYCSRDDGINFELTAGQRYTFTFTQERSYDGFTVSLGEPREWQDPGTNQIIHDSLSYRKQDNRYLLTAPTSGVYRFEIGKANAGVSIYVSVYDEAGYKLNSAYCHQGDGINIELTEGKTYYIHVIQESKYGEYDLTLGFAREKIDLSGCAYFRDSVYFRKQSNRYTFIPEVDGKYRIQVEKADRKVSIYIVVYDASDYKLNSGYCHQKDGISVELKAGQIYTVYVTQESDYGPYVLQFSH